MGKIFFLTGSQLLYGDETLNQVEKNSREIVSYLNENVKNADLEFAGVMKTSDEITATIKRINFDDSCIGIVIWCHTFSPSKMWINGLKLLQKPLLHLHTQYNEKLPYATIDMDFMNLNQAAHGDREFGYALARLAIPHEIVIGYYKSEKVIEKLNAWASVVDALDYSKKMKICRFGDNMREVAVTDGDRVEANIKFGWQTDYYGIGDIVNEIDLVAEEEVDALYDEICKIYTMATDNIASVKEQLRYEIALRRFMEKGNYKAFTTNFQALHGLKQLFGMSAQRLMADGYGFGAEGDWKIAALTAILKRMAQGKNGATVFMEDYTYDLTNGEELVLGSHMLEVCPTIAVNRPRVEVHPLGIGDREDPARLVFDGACGDAVAVCMVDMGDRFRLICADIELVEQPEPMPNLPVARVMWKIKPNFDDGVRAWLEAGGAHHTVVSTALTSKDIEMFASMLSCEFVHIG